MAIWNANNITNKMDELKNFLDEYSIDICLISETHAKPCNSLNIANYNTFRTDRLHHRGGGTAIFTKKHIKASLFKTDTTRGFEETNIIIEINNTNIHFSAIYNPPQNKITEADIKHILPSNLPTIMGGDLNSKSVLWGCRATNANGKIIEKCLGTEDVKIFAPTHPTYYSVFSKCKPDILDFVLTNTNLNIGIDVINDLSSDHMPLIATLGIDKEEENINRFKMNWELFQDTLAGTQENFEIESIQDVEECIQNLTNKITNTYKNSQTPITSKDNLLKLPPFIVKIIKHRNWIRKRFQKTLDPAYRDEMYSLNKKIREESSKFKNSRWNAKVLSLTTADQSLWGMTRSLKRAKTINRPIHGENGLVFTEAEKAEALADALERQFTDNLEPTDDDFEEIIETQVDKWLLNTSPENTIDPTDKYEVTNIINKLKRKKAPGKDNITNTMIKNLPPPIIDNLTDIFNKCIELSHFPDSWKEAQIILFLKPGKDPVMTTSYRPISLLSGFAKIFERIILHRMERFLPDIIPSEQYGFVPKKSTTQQLVRILEFIGAAHHNKQATALLMLDVAKAFDRVYHNGLIYKLIHQNFPNDIILLLQSYISNRTFRIKYGQTISSPRIIESGVPQGSILGPTLYILYTADFPTFKDDPNILVGFYADDTAIAVKSLNRQQTIKKLNQKMSDVEDWCEKWKVAINASKSNILIIGGRAKKKKEKIKHKVSLFDEIIPIVKQANYLGVTITNKLSWIPHLQKTKLKAKAAMARLRPLTGKRSKLNLNLKKLIYTSTIRPILTYASPAWTTATHSNIKILQTTQNKILREIVGATRYIRNNRIHEDLKIPKISEFISKQNINFYQKATNNEGDLKEILAYQILKEDEKTRPFAAFALSDAIMAAANY